MAEGCACPPEAGAAVCERRSSGPGPTSAASRCPHCSEPGKPVQRRTVSALLAVSLRAVVEADYRFCRTRDCPVVYFAAGGEPAFTTEEVRERVYQKQPTADDVWVCYCFRHTLGQIRTASPTVQAALVADITQGIQAGQCACDLRNPQGSCCLGNVRAVLQR